MIAEAGIEPALAAKEATELPLLYSAIFPRKVALNTGDFPKGGVI